jgi:hypothetical protein
MNTAASYTPPEGLRADIQAFISYKRALGRGFLTEERTLRLLERFFGPGADIQASQVTPEAIQTFLASRPRRSSRSYNHLLGVIREFFAWLVVQGHLDRSRSRVRGAGRTINCSPTSLTSPPLVVSWRWPAHCLMPTAQRCAGRPTMRSSLCSTGWACG